MRRTLALLRLLAFASVTFLALAARADGFIVINSDHWPEPPIHPHPPFGSPRPYVFAPLEVSYHHVNVRIDGQVATTAVDQEFYNPNAAQLEGTYLFPIPKGAQIDKFTMDIGGRQVEAELLSAEKARRIYEDIVRKARDPALLEYAGRDVFKVRIFPFEPHGRKRITLRYTQVLKADAGLMNYVYPLNTEKFSAKPIKNVSIKVEIENKQSLKSIYSPSHTIEVKRHGANRATVGFETSDAKPDTDFALYFAPEPDDLGVSLLTYKTGDRDGYFLLLVSPGLETKKQSIVPKDVAFVLDTSGSMAGKKMEQAKKALHFCVENLDDADRFEIIRFSTEVEPLFEKLADANRANRDRANEFVQDLKPIGGTAIDDALKKALSLRATTASSRPFVIIFLTDGRPTIGTTEEDQIVKNVARLNDDRHRIFCFGIGTDVNTHLLDKITEQTRAVSQYVLPEEDLEVKVSNFFSKIKAPVLANPTLKFTGDVRVSRYYPSPLPDLFRGDQIVLVGRYSGSGDTAVVLEGAVNGAARKFTYEVNFSKHNDEYEFIPRLWATRRVGYLLDEIRLHGENTELRDEVTELARKYGIVTPYTAYLIVEDEARRRVPRTLQSLPHLSEDSSVRKEAADNWRAFNSDVSGDLAVAGARSGYALKSAQAPVPATINGASEANRSLGFEGTATITTNTIRADSKARLAQYSQQGQFVGGRNFFQNSNQQWVDSTAQQLPNAKRQRIQFNSSEYFAFAAKHPQALPWLALGQNVQFELEGTLYEIHE